MQKLWKSLQDIKWGNESSDCDMKHKESLKCKYVPKKVKINSKDEIIFPKKGNY